MLLLFGLGAQVHRQHGPAQLVRQLAKIGFSVSLDEVTRYLQSARMTGNGSVVKRYSHNSLLTVSTITFERLTRNYGTVFCKEPTTGEAVIIYPGLTHLLKTQSKNFLTIPKTVKTSRHRVNKVRKFLDFLKNPSSWLRAAEQHSCLTKFELTTMVEVSLHHTLARAEIVRRNSPHSHIHNLRFFV